MVSTDDRSVHPNVPGVPWWGAFLLALTTTAIGFAFDAGSGTKELSGVFAALYVVGCIAAVLVVRQSSIFTAVVQPPLLLFVAVPGAYYLFHSGEGTGLKDTLINCGYPLIERFPLMIFTSGAVLLIGIARWYVGSSSRSRVNRTTDDTGARKARTGTLGAKLAALRDTDDEAAEIDADEAPTRKHSVDRSAAARTARRNGRTAEPAKAARNGRTPSRAQAARSRHSRPPAAAEMTDIVEPIERPRRSRDSATTPPPRRRSTARDPLPRERDREPYDSRAARERPSRYSRFEERYDERADLYEPAPRRRRPTVNGTNGTHHPISRVRYRGSPDEAEADDPLARRAPGSARSRRRPWEAEADSWEYDI